MGMDGAGVVSVGNTGAGSIGDVIDKDDKDRVLKSAQAMSLSSERRILHVLSQNFKVDERSGIEEPEGLTGSRLAANVHLVTSSRKTENDFKTCFDELSINISDFVLEPLASSYSILSKDEKKLGAIMIDIGGGTTDIVVWEDGGIKDTIIIPLGGEIITQDIARTIGCKIWFSN
jgi:cell division protein FtsA